MQRLSALLLVTVLMLFLLNNCGRKLTEEQLYSRGADQEQKGIELENMGKGDEAHNCFVEAAKSYEAMIDDYPSSEKCPEILYKLGTVYMNNLQDPEKSVNAYKRLIESYPQSNFVIQSYFMIGYRFANDIKDLDKAREAYNLFLEKFPDHELALSVKWELENLGKDISEIDFLESDIQQDQQSIKK